MPTPTDSQEELLEAIAAAIEPLADERVGGDRVRDPVRDRPQRPAGRSARSTSRCRTSRSADLTSERFGVPAAVENDANVGRARRVAAGRGAGRRTTWSCSRSAPGVGGGLVLGGALYRGMAELGHVVVVADGPPCQGNCTGRGHLEAVASGQRRRSRRGEAVGRGCERRAARRSGGGGRSGRARGARGDRSPARRRDRLVREHLRQPSSSSSAAASASPRSSSSSPSALEIARREAVEPDALPVKIVKAELGSGRGPDRRRAARVRGARGGVADAARRLRDADREPRGRDAARPARAGRGRRRALRGHAAHEGAARPARDPGEAAQLPPAQRGGADGGAAAAARGRRADRARLGRRPARASTIRARG